MLKTLLIALALAPLPAVAADLDALYSELDSGNLRGAADHIVELYEEAGASWDPSVSWDIDTYTRMFNTYSYMYEAIDIGDIPGPDEVDDYWQNWSKLLTEGRWSPGFFRDSGEARMLAAYNQFVLAAHEAGHVLKYRYDSNHFERHDYSVNCREFYADILAAGLLHGLSAADERFAKLQARYVALMADINAKVAPGLRYPPVTLAALEADCATAMTVEQPTPERMAAYASAYFVRQAVMIGGDLPPLSEIVDKYLVTYRDARVTIPYADPPVLVETIGYLADFEFRDETGDTVRSHTHSIPALTPSGQVYLVRLETDTGDGEEAGPVAFTLSYGRAPADLETLVSGASFGSEPIPDFTPLAAVAEGDDGFILMTRTKKDLVLSRYYRENGNWLFELANPIPYTFPDAVLTRTPAGRLFVLAGTSAGYRPDNAGRFAYELDARTLALKSERELPAVAGDPRAIDDEGNVYGSYLAGVSRTASAGTSTMLAGSSLYGYRDSAGVAAEFHGLALSDYTSVMQVTAAGDLVVVDAAPTQFATALRRLDLP